MVYDILKHRFYKKLYSYITKIHVRMEFSTVMSYLQNQIQHKTGLSPFFCAMCEFAVNKV